MTFSQEPYQDAISRNDRIPVREVAYFRQRSKQQVFGRLVSKFAERAKSCGLTKTKLSALIGKDPSQVNRILSLPSNMTIDSLSDMALAMGCEPEITFFQFDDNPCHNFVHDLMKEKVMLIDRSSFLRMQNSTSTISAFIKTKSTVDA